MASAARKYPMNNYRNERYPSYVEGNTIRRVQQMPLSKEEKTVEVSQTARRNRAKATSMSLGFVIFLAVVCTAILFMCVNYLQMKSQLTAKASSVAGLESEYSQLKADNDAYYSQVSSSADIEKIKAIAIKRLGMKYATEDQVVVYDTERSSYVKQYQDVPSAG